MVFSYLIKLLKFFREQIFNRLITFGFKLYYRKDDYVNPLAKLNKPNEYLFMPAHELARRIRSKEITSENIVRYYIERIKEVQPYLNCVVKTCFESAIEEAQRIDNLLSNDKNLPQEYSIERAPLLGVPFSCKESIWCKGMPNTAGIIARKDFVAPEDSDVVKYMRQAGAILTCLTNTSEGAMWFESSNYLYGTTKNPYNLSRIVGGSTGGEGCLISSSGSLIGIGSDIGGSIRMPAFFNGIYGHKPSSNFIVNNGHYPPVNSKLANEMLVTGPLCRYASDLRVLLKIFAGPRYSDVSSKFESEINLKQLKYYVLKPTKSCLLVSNLSFDSQNSINRAVEFIESKFNVKVKQIELKNIDNMFEIWNSMMKDGCLDKDKFENALGNYEVKVNSFLELFKSFFGFQTQHTLPALTYAILERLPSFGLKKYIEMGIEMRKELGEILNDDGIIIFPSFTVTSFYHNQGLFSHPFDYIYFGLVNSLGFPSTQIPLGLNNKADKLPTGVQLVSNHMNDHLTIALAEYFEKNLVGWTAPF